MKKVIVFLMAFSVCQAEDFVGILGDIVVYGKREIPASIVYEIGEEEIENSGSKNLAEILDKMSGSDVKKGGKGQSYLSIRGFQQNGVKVLIDGVPAYESYFGLLDLSTIPSEAIEKIVIVKGATSVLYGANTMGGVVNVITKKSGKKETSLKTFVGGGNRGGWNFSQSGEKHYVGGGVEKTDRWRLSSNFDRNNPVTGISSEYKEDGGKRELSYSEKKHLTAKLNHGFSFGEVNLSASFLDNPRGCPVAVNRYWEFTKWRQIQTKLNIESKISQNISLNGSFFYVGHEDELFDIDYGARTLAAGGESWWDKSSYDDFSSGGNFNSKILLEKNILNFGASFQKDNHQEKEFNTKNKLGDIKEYGWTEEEEYEANLFSLGAENIFLANEKMRFAAGASFDTFDPLKSGGQPTPEKISSLNPQCSFSFDVSDSISAFASAGRKVRFPRLKELYSEHAGGNPKLKEEKAIFGETGFNFSGKNSGLSFSYFYNGVSDLIDRETRDDDWVNINKKTARLRGFEMSGKTLLPLRIPTNFDYTYLDAEDEKGADLNLRPKHKLSVSLFRDFPNKFKISIIPQWVGSQKEDERKISGHSVLDLKIAKKIKTTADGEIFLEISNVFDRNFEEGGGPEPGRNFTAGLNFSF